MQLQAVPHHYPHHSNSNPACATSATPAPTHAPTSDPTIALPFHGVPYRKIAHTAPRIAVSSAWHAAIVVTGCQECLSRVCQRCNRYSDAAWWVCFGDFRDFVTYLGSVKHRRQKSGTTQKA